MKTVCTLFMLLLAAHANLMAQDSTIRQKIEQAVNDPKMLERSAKADALLISKKQIFPQKMAVKSSASLRKEQ